MENIYNSRSLFVAQCLVVGRSLKVSTSITKLSPLPLDALVQRVLSSHMLVPCFCVQATVVAVIVPDQEYLTEWANLHGFPGGMEELCANAVSIEQQSLLQHATVCVRACVHACVRVRVCAILSLRSRCMVSTACYLPM